MLLPYVNMKHKQRNQDLKHHIEIRLIYTKAYRISPMVVRENYDQV